MRTKHAFILGLAVSLTAGNAFIPTDAAAQGYGYATFSAVGNAAGGTVRSAGVQGSSRTATGKYQVEFSRPIAACAVVAATNSPAGGHASAKAVAGKPSLLEVWTFDKAGTATNRAFTVLVNCAS